MFLSWFAAPKCESAETRAVNRALRKAYGIGICPYEEIRHFTQPRHPPRESRKTPAPLRPMTMGTMAVQGSATGFAS